MKKKFISWIIALAFSLQPGVVTANSLIEITHNAGYTDALESNQPKASIIIDAKSGDVLWEDNADTLRDPASMSKMLALYLVFEAMENGKFNPDTIVTATETDQAIASIYEISNNKIVAGVDYTVAELIIATIVPSSNAATLMLANLVEPDPDAFIDLMSAKAAELGMTNTTINNGTGAVIRAFQGHYAVQRHDIYSPNETTVRDWAILTYHFVNRFPSILDYTGESYITIKAGTPYEETFKSYNYSLPDGKYALEGVNGLKTGSSPSAGFNITATAKREDQELIAVLMGVGDWSDQNGEFYRHPFLNALLEKGFSEYDYQQIAPAGKAEASGKTVTLEEPIYGTVPVGQTVDLVYADNHVTVSNGLTKVSPLVAEQQAVVAKSSGLFGFGNSDSNDTSAQTNKKGGFLQLFLGVLSAILVVIGLIYLIEKRSRKDRRGHKMKQTK
ncbi:D-alanyl-D-alanine carboxypeptidase family protein [Streptococcus moroccensis]|uniref:D-alanyl-D-alanine carboxypeptidase n=1 Tax=Streptococcus moroccensis TaxID=1451356 RepID=A0ABT9YTC0_9STRE|nr:serine hydrolase [Streptococcus moroccensis]MDQ0223241.1 D-alanyl-D-alanine carboxypeptidase [Streptococcus moroccensis]